MKLIKLYNHYTNIIVASFFIFFPLLFWPVPVQMPRSKGYDIAFYNTSYDMFEYCKLIALILLASVLLFMLAVKVMLIKHPIYVSLPLLSFVSLILVSTIFSKNPEISFIGLPTKWQGFVTYVCYLIVFTYIFNTFRKKNLEKYIIYLLTSSSIVGLLSILSFYGFDIIHTLITGPICDILNIRLSYSADLVKGPIGNRISLGAYFSLFFPISLFTLIYYKKHIPLYLITTLLCFAGLLVSQSRTAWIGVFLGIVILIIKEYKQSIVQLKTLAVIFITMSLLIVLIDYSGGNKLTERFKNFQSQIEAIQNGEDSNNFGSMRGFAYKRALLATKEHPLLGVGPDCYMYYGILTPEDYKQYPAWRNTTIVTKAHSEYLEFLSTLGIPAFLLYSYFLLQIILIIFKKPKKYNPLWLALFSGFFSYILQAAANIGVIAVLPLFFSVCALLSRYYSKSNNPILNNLSYITIHPYKKRGLLKLL